MERQTVLEGEKTQLELDCQRRLEDAQGNTYERSEDLIKTLSKAKTEVREIVVMILTNGLKL